MTLSSFLPHLSGLLTGELGRLTASFLIVFVAAYASRMATRWVAQGPASADSKAQRHKLREKLVWTRNFVFLGAALALAALWASKIAGLALSLAAVAGGLLIVSKEFLMCALGYAMLSITRPYRIGDFIELSGMHGRVTDIDLFSTTLAETGAGHQVNGRSITFPNSMLLSQPVRNASATGRFIINMLAIVVPFDASMPEAERCALEAAAKTTSEWAGEAEKHLEALEQKDFVDLPSAKPKVIWADGDAKYRHLVLRFTCPSDQRVAAEQAIYREFWLQFAAAK